jgi:hypothetical protein
MTLESFPWGLAIRGDLAPVSRGGFMGLRRPSARPGGITPGLTG